MPAAQLRLHLEVPQPRGGDCPGPGLLVVGLSATIGSGMKITPTLNCVEIALYMCTSDNNRHKIVNITFPGRLLPPPLGRGGFVQFRHSGLQHVPTGSGGGTAGR